MSGSPRGGTTPRPRVGSSRLVKSNTKALDAFVKGISRKYVVKIGIFGATDHADHRQVTGSKKSAEDFGGHEVGEGNASLTNADLAAIHELGSYTAGIPARPFLRMPLHQKSEDILKEAKKGAAALLARGEVLILMKRLGIAAENAVQRAFATGGFGKWPALKASTIKRKGSSRELIDTRQLRLSITSTAETAT